MPSFCLKDHGRTMNRRPKNSHKLSSQHDSTTSLSRSPYESNEDNDDDDDYNSQQPIISESVTNTDQLSSDSYSNSRPTNSYVNVAPLPVFHGNSDECAVAHLSRFVKVCRANNASSTGMMMRIFPVTLENEAALWYVLNIEPYSSSLSWDEIKSSFLEAYHRVEMVDQLRSDLMMLNQGSDESVRSYFLRLQWILKRWPDHGLSDNMLKGIFIDGLMTSFKEWVIPQKPSSLIEALRLAFSFEQVKSIRSAKQKAMKCGFCEGSHEESCCVFRDKLRELFKKSKEEKKRMVFSEGNDSFEAMKGTGESKDDEEGDVDDKEEKEMMFSRRKSMKSQCQCSKHQCWMKKLDRNNSAVSRNSTAE